MYWGCIGIMDKRMETTREFSGPGRGQCAECWVYSSGCRVQGMVFRVHVELRVRSSRSRP